MRRQLGVRGGALLALAALGLAGCAVGGGSPASLSVGLMGAAMAMWLLGCNLPGFDLPLRRDGGQEDAGRRDGGWKDGDGGTWEPCCVNGRSSTCYCPPNTACNYGQGLHWCEDGTCADEFAGEVCPGGDGRADGGQDAGLDGGADADAGTWEACCEDGRLTTCYCPPQTECNYGMGLVLCPDGACTDDAPDPDGGEA